MSEFSHLLATSATGPHPFPSRTRSLSLSAPMVLRLRGRGRVGRRQLFIPSPLRFAGAGFVFPQAGGGTSRCEPDLVLRRLEPLPAPCFHFSVYFPAMTKCGTVVLAGRPNVGKSTLLNALIGEHLAIISPKPQSTRVPVVGILTRDDTQFVVTDSPGLLAPEYRLHETMRAHALRALADAEVIAYLHPLAEFPAPPLREVAKLDRAPKTPIVTVYTKADLAPTSTALHQPPPSSTAIVSAVTREGLDRLLDTLRAHLPESPFHYDPDAMATQPLRFFAAASVREAAFELLHEEVPYSLAVEIDQFRE